MSVRIGDIGRAVTPMSPSGAVEVNGKRLDARSDGPFIDAGSPIIVLRGDPTGYVVRKLEADQPTPKLPNHGKPIRKAEFQRNSAEVEQAEREERAEKRRRFRKMIRYGSIVAGSLGALVGLASGAAGWLFGWYGAAEAGQVAVLLGGSMGVGAVAGVALFFLTGLIGSVMGFFEEGDAELAPDFLAIFAALVGAAVGFWWQFETGDAADIALWSLGVATVFALVAYFLSWLIRQGLEATAEG